MGFRRYRDHGAAARAGRTAATPRVEEKFFRSVLLAVAADVIRPPVSLLVVANWRRGALPNALTESRDPQGFTGLRELCSADPAVNRAAATRICYRTAIIVAAKGGTITDITTGDVLELLETEAHAHGSGTGAVHTFYRMLRTMGVFGDHAPATLRELRTIGQLTPDELIDRYRLTCRPIRNLLVDYLRERQPALDYTSLDSLANMLGRLFWADLERHHPGIGSLHLAPEVAADWNNGYAPSPARPAQRTAKPPRSRPSGSTTAPA